MEDAHAMSLFDAVEKNHREQAKPLAARMRPRSLSEFVGQQHFLAPGKRLRRLLQADRLMSLLFAGPPGTGKTTLANLLARLRLDANIGVEDLTRLITAAEAEAATRPLAGLTARHLMSRDLVTVAPDTPLPALAATFRRHRFKTLPMVQDGNYLGLIAEEALVGVSDPALTAADLSHPAAPASPDTPAAGLVQRLADGREQALPITEAGQLVGLVTRSDLIALLARSLTA